MNPGLHITSKKFQSNNHLFLQSLTIVNSLNLESSIALCGSRHHWTSDDVSVAEEFV